MKHRKSGSPHLEQPEVSRGCKLTYDGGLEAIQTRARSEAAQGSGVNVFGVADPDVGAAQ